MSGHLVRFPGTHATESRDTALLLLLCWLFPWSSRCWGWIQAWRVAGYCGKRPPDVSDTDSKFREVPVRIKVSGSSVVPIKYRYRDFPRSAAAFC